MTQRPFSTHLQAVGREFHCDGAALPTFRGGALGLRLESEKTWFDPGKGSIRKKSPFVKVSLGEWCVAVDTPFVFLNLTISNIPLIILMQFFVLLENMHLIYQAIHLCLEQLFLVLLEFHQALYEMYDISS